MSLHIQRPKFVTILFGCLLFMGAFGVSSSIDSDVYANCGVQTGSAHDYAGAVIDVVAIRKDGSTVQVGNNVRIVSINPSTGGGNLYNYSNGARAVDGEFNQIGGCGDNKVVLGYGATSQRVGGPGGVWTLDCDISIRPANDPLQRFSVTGVGVPSGLNTPTPAEIAKGYGWQEITIKPQNGYTAVRTLVFKEPPDQTSSTLKLFMSTSSDCRVLHGHAYQWPSGSVVRVRLQIPKGGTLVPALPTATTNPAIAMPGAPTPPWSAAEWNVNFMIRLSDFGINGESLWPPQGGNITVRLAAWTNDTAQTPLGGQDFVINTSGCRDYGPSLSASGNCSSVSVNAFDQNAALKGRQSVFTIKAYERNAGGGRGPAAYKTTGELAEYAGQGNMTINNLQLDERDGVNNGYVFAVSMIQTDRLGDDSPGPTTDVITGPCLAAQCTLGNVNVPVDPSRPRGVRAGQAFTVPVTLTNTGEIPIPVNKLRAAYDYPAGNRVSFASTPAGPIVKGASATAIISATAPNDINSWSVYPYFFDTLALGPACGTIDIFVPFDIQPNAGTVDLTPNGDTESPTGVSFTSNAVKTQPAGKNDVTGVSVVRTIVNKTNNTNVGGPFNDKNATLGSKNYTDTSGIGGRDTAAEYCGVISVAPAAGFLGPGGARIVTVATREDQSDACAKIVNKPYVRAYNGDVVAGAVFPDPSGSCTLVNSDIKANTRPLGEQGSKSGSGGQLGVFAPGVVNGFFSAMLRGSNPQIPIGLTLGGSNPTGSVLSPNLGGAYKGDRCLEDYFTQRQSADPLDFQNHGGATSVNVDSLTDEKQSRFNGNTTLDGGSLPLGKRHSIFVDGDLNITGNINAATAYAGNPSNIPSLRIFVKGDVYIASGVTNLDATIVAQPKADGTKGVIYTCSSGFSEIADPSQRYNNCRNRLTVYGSFVANKVVLGRTINTLADSKNKESRQTSTAAEVFVFTPDTYLSNSAVRPTSNPTSGDYQFIATLPPIL